MWKLKIKYERRTTYHHHHHIIHPHVRYTCATAYTCTRKIHRYRHPQSHTFIVKSIRLLVSFIRVFLPTTQFDKIQNPIAKELNPANYTIWIPYFAIEIAFVQCGIGDHITCHAGNQRMCNGNTRLRIIIQKQPKKYAHQMIKMDTANKYQNVMDNFR